MKTGYTISALIHALLMAWGLWTFQAQPLKAPQVDPIVVEVVTDTEVSQITAGSTTAKQTPAPTPVADKVGEVKEQPKEPLLKVAKEEVVTTTAPPPAPPDPAPEPPKPDVKKPDVAKPADAKPAETPPPPAAAADPAPDLVAEEIKRQEKQKEEQKKLDDQKKRDAQKKLDDQKKRDAQKKLDDQKKREQVKNDLNDIQAALNDKRAPSRREASNTMVNPNPSLGTTTGRAPQLSQNEQARLLAALQRQLKECWNVPNGVTDARDLVVTVEFWLDRAGNLSAMPVVKNTSSNPMFRVAADSALKAVRLCQPFRLPAAQYDFWQDVEIDFDPKAMFGG
jgi:colicin import membrane protein